MKRLLGLCFLASSAFGVPAALHVVTLNTVLTEIAREVGGDQVRVTGLVKPDVDPHTFDPSAAEVRVLVDADLVLASGLGLESYLDRLVANSGGRGQIVAVGDELPVVLAHDPHWWHSLANMQAATERVRREYARLRPAAAGTFARRAETYRQGLAALQAWVAGEIATLPPAQRELLTSHNAFGYFAHDYGFRAHAISGISTDGEPDARHLAQLIDLVRARRIKAVFVEASVNPRLVQNLIAETGVRLGGTLYADGLGQGEAATYAGMFRHNVRSIVDGLR